MRAAIAASISFAALLGCGGKPVPTGTFQGERPLPVNPGTDPAVADQLRRVVLTIDDSGKGNLEDGGIPWEGLVSRSGDRLDFEILAVSGINIAKQSSDYPRQLRFRIESDGTILFGDVRLRRK